MAKQRLEQTKTERRAIHFLESPIADCDYLDSSINSMDKELSWDGYIYTYNDKIFSNKSLEDKIPIQVKGHRDDDHKEINKKSIQFSVELDVLKNYYNDKGVLYFRILLSDTKKEIFYSILYPSKIKYYLDEAKRKKNKKYINITLMKLKPTASEMLRICRQFTFESSKQGSGRGQIVPKSIYLSDIKKYKKLQATAIDTRTPFEFLQRLSTGDVCFYANEEKSNFWLPVMWHKGIQCFVGQLIEQDIIINGTIFYTRYEVITGTDESLCIRISPNLIINMSKGTFDFKKISSIEELYNDARFLKEMINNTEIIIGSNILKYDNLKLNDDLKKDLDFIIDFYDICKMGNMQIVVPLSEFEEIDIQNAIRVVGIFRGKIEIKTDYIYTYNLKIAERIYPFIVYRDEHDKVQFVNRIYESKYQGYITTNDNHYKVPMFCDMKRDVLGHLYRYDYADLLYQVDNAEFNVYTLEILNYAVIELIGAYDISREEKLLEIAEYIIKRMYSVDDTIIYARMNEWQILKRQDKLIDVHRNVIKNFLKEYQDNNQILCGLYALLDDKKTAKNYLNKLQKEDRDVFVTFPIYKYVAEDE